MRQAWLIIAVLLWVKLKRQVWGCEDGCNLTNSLLPPIQPLPLQCTWGLVWCLKSGIATWLIWAKRHLQLQGCYEYQQYFDWYWWWYFESGTGGVWVMVSAGAWEGNCNLTNWLPNNQLPHIGGCCLPNLFSPLALPNTLWLLDCECGSSVKLKLFPSKALDMQIYLMQYCQVAKNVSN